MRIWDACPGTEMADRRGTRMKSKARFLRLTAPPHNRGPGRAVRFWDTVSGAEIAVLRGHEPWSPSADIAPNGVHIVTASDYRKVRLWDAIRGAEIAIVSVHEDVVTTAVFAPDGARIVTGSYDKAARILERPRAPRSWSYVAVKTVESATFAPMG